MQYDVGEKSPELATQGLLQAGRFLWARALPWSVVLGIALWLAYKFVKRVGIDLGLGGTGLPTGLGVLAALACYVVGIRLVERRSPNELDSVFQVRPVAGVSTFWSGGAFGPEASMATLIMGLLVGAALLALAKRRTLGPVDAVGG